MSAATVRQRLFWELAEDLLRGADAAEARKNFRDGELVRLRFHAAHRILGEDDFVAALPRIARGRFHAEVRGDSAEHDCFDAAAAQLQIEIGSVERAPLPLADEDVALARAELRNDVAPIGRELRCRI